MYRFELINNHYIINIDNKKYLLDTGSPNSFWVKEPIREITIDGINYPLSNRPSNLDIKETEECVGLLVDGFIGMDIIRQTSLTIYKNGYIDFRSIDIDGNEIELNTYGLLTFRVGSNLMDGYYIIDTGAKYGYGVKGLFYGLIPYDHVNDYNPILKHLDSDIYHLDVVVGNEIRVVDVCDNYKVSLTLKNMMVMMIGNITSLFDEVCVIDMKRKVLVLK